LQSIISINQVGLAIWGWITAGLIIAYTKLDQNAADENQKGLNRKDKSRINSLTGEVLSPRLFAGVLAVVGLLFSVPPLSADMKWRSAQLSQDVAKVEAILIPSYMNPLSTIKIINVVGVFETNGFHDLAYKYALEAVRFNPDSYETWRTITLLTKATEQEKIEALVQMKRLDPLNPNLKDLSK
jgi:hypothetical protein